MEKKVIELVYEILKEVVYDLEARVDEVGRTRVWRAKDALYRLRRILEAGGEEDVGEEV